MHDPYVVFCEKYSAAASRMRFVDGMFGAAARYRIAMSVREPRAVHDGIRAIARRVARDALYAENIMCLEFERLIDAVVVLGSEYIHRYDKPEYQMVIISSFFNTFWFSKLCIQHWARGQNKFVRAPYF